jgi:hypothetical protein
MSTLGRAHDETPPGGSRGAGVPVVSPAEVDDPK